MKIKSKKNVAKKRPTKKLEKVPKKDEEFENATAEPVNEADSDEEVAKLDGEDSLDGSEEDETITVGKGGLKKHKLDLEKLKETDPEFFKFLQQEDADLLELDDAEDEEEMEDEEDDEEEEEDEYIADGEKKVPRPKLKLDRSSKRYIVDARLYNYLESVLDPEGDLKDVHHSDIRLAVDVFVACVSRVGADMEAPKFIINEESIFEAVVRLCFQSMPDAIKVLLKAKEQEDKTVISHKLVKKHKGFLRTYLHAIVVFLSEVQSTEVINATLKSISRLLDIFVCFKKSRKVLIKALTKIWSRKTLDCRLSAFVCMNLFAKRYPQHFSSLYKACYVAFVANSKLVSNETWPLLQFMHRSFAELTTQAPQEAYKFAFVYIRQTAVHLRNAMIGKGRKDLILSVYNWQMIQCMYMWVRVIAKSHSVHGAESVAELVYPLTQVIIGIFKLCNAPAFLPLRLHCCQLLIQLQASCTTYIPVLSLSCDVLEEFSHELKKKPMVSKGSVKLPDIECTLRVSSQYSNLPQWRKLVAEYIFRTMMQASHLLSSQAAFADLVLPLNYRINKIIGEMKNADFVHLFRGLVNKFKEHSKFVIDILDRKDVRVDDEVQVLAVRFEINNPDSPLKSYYRQWEKVWKMKENAVLEKNAAKQRQEEKDAKKRKAKDDDDDEENDVKPVLPKQKRKRAKIGAAAPKADSTVPDRFADLNNWSDDEDEK